MPDPRSASDTDVTDWSMVHRAAGDEAEAWEMLARRYWPAIYAYVRRSGRPVDDAADLTQGFVCDVMLGRRLLETADPRKGRFRTLLMTSLRNYMVQQHRHATRKKRAPETGRIIGNEAGTIDVASGPDETPEAAFAAQWTAALVRSVVEKVKRECDDESLATHWAVFEARVVRPLLHGDPPVQYEVLVDRLGLADVAQAQNMMITVKRRFARFLHQEVGDTVRDPRDIDDEIFALLNPAERPDAEGPA